MNQRKQMVRAKREELEQLPKRELIDRICNYPDQRSLNMDAEGNWRKHPVGNMAHRIRDGQHYQMTDKQYYSLIHHYPMLTIPELRVVGVTHHTVDPMQLERGEVERDGTKFTYDMQFHLRPEPENPYDANAVAVYAATTSGDEKQLGYVARKFLEQHPITQEMNITGTMIDFSNGHFNNVSYRFPLDIEQLEADRPQKQEIASDLKTADCYVYEKPIALSEDCRITDRAQLHQWLQERDQQSDTSSFLTTMVKNELDFWNVDGKGDIQQVSYQFPTTREGVVSITSNTPLSSDALSVVDSYITYIQEGAMASALRECPYVQTPLSADVFAQTNGRLRMTAEPSMERVESEQSTVEPVTQTTQGAYGQMTMDDYLASMPKEAATQPMRYQTSFFLTTDVLDVAEAQAYLSEDDMTEILKERYPDLAADVTSIQWVLTDSDCGYVELETNRSLTDAELARISEWVSGQNSDGIGEGFEQQPFAWYPDADDAYDDTYVMASFDHSSNDYIFAPVSSETMSQDADLTLTDEDLAGLANSSSLIR